MLLLWNRPRKALVCRRACGLIRLTRLLQRMAAPPLNSRHVGRQGHRNLGEEQVAEEETFVAKKPSKHGKSWSSTEVKELKRLAKENTPTRVIGLKLDRTEGAVRSKASALEVSLKPTNQSPYNRAPKAKPAPSRKPAKKTRSTAAPSAPKRKGTRSTGPRARRS